MALFVKKTEEETEVAMLYSTGLDTTKVFVGLGNPGKKYENNRHNIGFRVIEVFAKNNGISNWTEKKDLKCELAYGDISGTRVILIKPTTYMNESGQALQAVLNYYKLAAEEATVIYDEADIDFGKIQVRSGGTAAGHNGVKSLLTHNANTFTRVRVGVGPKQPAQIDLADFVLQDFSKDSQEDLELIINEVAGLLGEATVSALNPETRNALI